MSVVSFELRGVGDSPPFQVQISPGHLPVALDSCSVSCDCREAQLLEFEFLAIEFLAGEAGNDWIRMSNSEAEGVRDECLTPRGQLRVRNLVAS